MHTYDCTVTLMTSNRYGVFVPPFSVYASDIGIAANIAKAIVTTSSCSFGLADSLTGIIMVTKSGTSICKEFFFINGVEVTREAWRNPNR